MTRDASDPDIAAALLLQPPGLVGHLDKATELIVCKKDNASEDVVRAVMLQTITMPPSRWWRRRCRHTVGLSSRSTTTRAALVSS